MEFGKIDSPEGIDFALPPDHANRGSVLSGEPFHDRCFHLGLTGWGEREWVGSLYPEGTRPNQFLPHYCLSFSSVELNSTFYGLPKEEVLKQWRNNTPDHFRFYPKVWRVISHRTDLGLSTGAVKDFVRMTHGLEGKLGGSFLQLPPGFSEIKRTALLRFLEAGPTDSTLFLEFRDIGWLEDNTIMEAATAARFGLVITDTPGRRDLLHMRLCIPRTMIRFVASGFPEIDAKRIQDWAVRLDDWFRNGLQEVAFFCHQPDNRHAPDLARLCRQTFQQPDLSHIPPIPEIIDHATRQGNLFASAR